MLYWLIIIKRNARLNHRTLDHYTCRFTVCKNVVLYQYLLQYVTAGPTVSAAGWRYRRGLFTDRKN
jgi:hypothetical protein